MARAHRLLVSSLVLMGCADLADLGAYGPAASSGGGATPTGGGGAGGLGGDVSQGAGGGQAGSGGDPCVIASCTNYAALVACDGAIAHWPLDEQSGFVTADVIGDRDGEYQVGEAVGNAGAFGYALEVDGTDAKYVTIPSNGFDYPANGVFTVELWLQTSNLEQGAPGRGLVTHFSGGIEQPGWGMTLVNVPDGAHVEAETTGGSSENVTSVTPGQWHHVVGVFESNVMVQVYLDGDPAMTQAITTALDPAAVSLVLGCRRKTNGDIDQCFDGRIDEVAIYDSALPPPRIEAHAKCLP